MKKSIFFILALTLVGYSCSTKSKKESVKPEKVEVKIERLETKLTSFQDGQEVVNFLKEYPDFANQFLGLNQYPHPSILVDNMLRMAQEPSIDTLKQGVDQTFPSLQPLESKLSTAYGYLKHYYPDYQIPTIYTMISGYGSDLFLQDSMAVIGLDFFSTGKGKYYPKDIPYYILKYYTEDYLPTKLMALTSQRFNKNDLKKNTLLDQMIYYGKAYYFVEHMLPQAPDSVVIEYSAKEIDDLSVMAPKVWAHFIENKLFFDASRALVRRYIEDRPNTNEIADKCPGRIGRWLGWQIVRAYMEKNDDITLQMLMEEDDAAKIFKEAKYKPS